MDLSQEILAEIAQVTRTIEDKYPELQKYLNEKPMTLPEGDNSDVEMNNDDLRDYLNSLKELITKYDTQ